jgi:hypothetical protein
MLYLIEPFVFLFLFSFENPEVGYKNGAKNFKTSLGYGNLDI